MNFRCQGHRGGMLNGGVKETDNMWIAGVQDTGESGIVGVLHHQNDFRLFSIFSKL